MLDLIIKFLEDSSINADYLFEIFSEFIQKILSIFS